MRQFTQQRSGFTRHTNASAVRASQRRWRDCERLLDSALAEISDNPTAEVLDRFLIGLRNLRRVTPQEEWVRFARTAAARHPLRELLHRDPFTKRAFEKPRGYPGDAVLLDYIYYPERIQHALSGAAAELYAYTSSSPACRAVRFRRHRLAALVDEAAARRPGAYVFSFACGHLREAELSEAWRRGAIGRWVAADQDPVALATVASSVSGNALETVQLTVRQVIENGRVPLSGRRYDVVYAAGLCDYLDAPVARRLTRILFESLASGGVLLVANFLPEIFDVGYMEAFMGWWLVFRDASALGELTADVRQGEIAGSRTYTDDDRNIVFLELQRA